MKIAIVDAEALCLQEVSAVANEFTKAGAEKRLCSIPVLTLRICLKLVKCYMHCNKMKPFDFGSQRAFFS